MIHVCGRNRRARDCPDHRPVACQSSCPSFPRPKCVPSVNTLLPPALEVTEGPSHPSEDRSQVLPLPVWQVGPQLLWEELAALSLTQIPCFLTPGAQVSSSHTFGGLFPPSSHPVFLQAGARYRAGRHTCAQTPCLTRSKSRVILCKTLHFCSSISWGQS